MIAAPRYAWIAHHRRVQAGGFVPYLPQDNQTWQAQEVLALLNQGLSRLLRLPPAEFWSAVEDDSSLHVFIDSYLHHKRCAWGAARGAHATRSLQHNWPHRHGHCPARRLCQHASPSVR